MIQLIGSQLAFGNSPNAPKCALNPLFSGECLLFWFLIEDDSDNVGLHSVVELL